MGSQIDELLEKYWNGETSLEEEKRIKDHFKSTPTLSQDGKYFRYLAKEKNTTYEGPMVFKKSKTWLSVAATVTVGVITAALAINEANKDPFAIDDPQKALQATREALMMISSSLNEAQDHTMELTKINKAKEELQEDS